MSNGIEEHLRDEPQGANLHKREQREQGRSSSWRGPLKLRPLLCWEWILSFQVPGRERRKLAPPESWIPPWARNSQLHQKTNTIFEGRSVVKQNCGEIKKQTVLERNGIEGRAIGGGIELETLPWSSSIDPRGGSSLPRDSNESTEQIRFFLDERAGPWEGGCRGGGGRRRTGTQMSSSCSHEIDHQLIRSKVAVQMKCNVVVEEEEEYILDIFVVGGRLTLWNLEEAFLTQARDWELKALLCSYSDAKLILYQRPWIFPIINIHLRQLSVNCPKMDAHPRTQSIIE